MSAVDGGITYKCFHKLSGPSEADHCQLPSCVPLEYTCTCNAKRTAATGVAVNVHNVDVCGSIDGAVPSLNEQSDIQLGTQWIGPGQARGFTPVCVVIRKWSRCPGLNHRGLYSNGTRLQIVVVA